jgi:positive regulator of sigma E activity
MGLVPGRGELLAWILALVVAMLVTWIADTLGTADWMNFFLWTTVAYLLSRGIAKATRVYEM